MADAGAIRKTGQRFVLILLGLFVLNSMAWADSRNACSRRVTTGEDLQVTLDGLPENGSHQIVCLDAGTFHLKDMVVLERNNLTLRGAGPDKSILQMASGVSSPVLVLGDAHHQEPQRPIRQVTVEGLGIHGGGHSDSEFRPDLPYLSNSGLIVRRGEQITLRNLELNDCRSACLLTEYHSKDVLMENNHVSGAEWDGISLNRAGPTRIIGNTIENNTAAGITVEFMEGSEIRNNVIANNGSHGLYLADAEHNRFEKNMIRTNAGAGVFLTCSVRDRDPVLCWDNSFSRDNTFVDNRFEHNRFGYQVAVDKAANCLDFPSPPNVSRGDTFVDSPNHEPAWEEYGHCLAYDGSKAVETVSQKEAGAR